MRIPEERPQWDAYFLDLCEAVAARADCSRRKVGAVIVNEDHRVIGTGYNGGPSGGPSCLAGECPRGLKTRSELPSYEDGNHDFDSGANFCIAIHAEMNAITFSDYTQRRNGVLYVTCEPCEGCWKVIKNCGVSRVVWRSEGEIVRRFVR